MDAQQTIQTAIDNHDVMLFMKGTPELPQCGFSSMVSQIFHYLGVEFASMNVLEDETIRQGIKTYSSWPTVPQLYVKGEFVGGCDIVREMFEKGELKDFLTRKGIALSTSESA